MINEYVQKIIDWPTITMGKELASCLGFFSYYRSFLPDYIPYSRDEHSEV
jgi:hypothetical protein